MKNIKLCALAVLSGLLLAGCGGDGDDDRNYSPDRSLAQGVYDGTITYNNGGRVSFSQQTIVLENGEYFIVYGETIENVFFVDGFLHGTGRIEEGTNNFFSFDLADYFFVRGSNSLDAVFDGDLRANFSSGVFFNGTARQRDSFVEFSGNAPTAATYDYNTAASLPNITGDWAMRDLLGAPLTISIAESGGFTGSYASGCALSGTLTPRASGKNVFDMTITNGATPCSQPGLTFTGVAIESTPSTTARALVMAGTTTSGNNGTALYGTR